MLRLLCLLCVLCVVLAQEEEANGGDKKDEVFDLPSGAEEVVGEVTPGFTCDDKKYGYYADVSNDCKVFHVCNPLMNEEGEVTRVQIFSFFCGNQTVFDQKYLICNTPEDAIPCNEAESYYNVNDKFFEEGEEKSGDGEKRK